MPAPRKRTNERPAPGPLPNGQAARAPAAVPRAGNGSARSAPWPEEPGNGGRAGRRASEAPEPALRGLLRGLHAGDLETVLLTVAMAAEENRMPSADPDEARRILRFLARLAEHDAGLPPPTDGPRGGGPGTTRDGMGAGDGAPAPR